MVEVLKYSQEIYQRQFLIVPQKPPIAEWIKNHIGDQTLHVHMRANDNRMINNLLFQVVECSKEKRCLIATFTQLDEIKPFRPISIEQVQLDDRTVHVGDMAVIVLSGIDEHERASFFMAVTCDVDVHSIEHRANVRSQLSA